MTQFVLRPRDGLTLKDARGFNVAGGDGAKSLAWLWPTTLAGSVRTAVGVSSGYSLQGDPRWAALRDSVSIQGPLPVTFDGQSWQPVFPAPADAIRWRTKGDPETLDVEWLRPKARSSGAVVRGSWRGADEEIKATEGLLVAAPIRADKPATMPRWWSREQFVAWLQNCRIPKDSHPVCEPPVRGDFHVVMNPETGKSKEGGLFSVETLEPVATDGSEWGVWGSASERVDTSRPWRLGGEARFAAAESLAVNPFEFPASLDWATTKRLRLLLLTPAVFRAGWRPDWLEPRAGEFVGEWAGLELTLRAAFVPRSEAISGWDLVARGPRASRRMAPAGSVYYFECGTEVTLDVATSLWMRSVQDPDSQESRDGFGAVAPGRWPEEQA